jgi:hypothetical protein
MTFLESIGPKFVVSRVLKFYLALPARNVCFLAQPLEVVVDLCLQPVISRVTAGCSPRKVCDFPGLVTGRRPGAEGIKSKGWVIA